MRNFFKKLRSDSWSKYFSKTVQRVGKNNAGFSLVELIVVIAIMAVLAAVAVIGVSIYIPKAQKAADEQMIADIKTAVDLYANLESVQPGQSGYIVIHKDKGTGKTSGNVSVGGSMEGFLIDALEATFGEGKYGTELKVSYGEWSGNFNRDEITALKGSVYTDMNNGVSNTQDLMQSVDSLTGVLSSYYGGEDAQHKANSAVLAVAQSANSLSKENYDKFVEWWANGLSEELPSSAIFGDPTKPESLMSAMAAQYARYKAVVLSTGCSECMRTFSNNAPFEGTQNSDAAQDALNDIIDATVAHVYGENGEVKCGTCDSKIQAYTGDQAKYDAKAYLAMLGEIDDMSDDIKNQSTFGQAGFFKGEYIQGIVSDYLTEIDVYSDGAEIGDIVISVTVKSNGTIEYKSNLPE